MPEITVKLGDSVVQNHAFDKDVFSVGRSRDNDIVLETLSVSRNHARIRREGEQYIVTDLNSANGTLVNGVKVSRAEVMDGDIITVGKHNLHFSLRGLSDEQAIADAFGSERTILVDTAPIGYLIVQRGKQKDQEFAIDRYETYVGKGDECQVRLHDWFVGKRHALILRKGGNFTIKDLGKLSGVHVNDQAVREPRALSDGDVVKVGPVQMLFRVGSPVPIAPLPARKPIEIPYEDSPSDLAVPAPGEPAEPELDEELDDMESAVSRIEDDEEEEEAPAMAPEPTPVAAVVEAPAAKASKSAPPSRKPKPDEIDDDIESPIFDLISDALDRPATPKPVYEEPSVIAETLAAEAALREKDQQTKTPVHPSERAVVPDANQDDLPLDIGPVTAAEPAPADASAASPATPEAPLTPIPDAAAAPDESVAKEVALWEKALQNPSPLIRREAAKMLKKITGKTYDV